MLTHFSERRGLVGPALLRVGFSITAIVNYLWHLGIWSALWGPRGEIDLNTYRGVAFVHLDPYAWASSDAWSFGVFVSSIVIAVAFGVGIAPRITSWLFVVTVFANNARSPFATDAGQDLLVLVAFLLCFADTSQCLRLPWLDAEPINKRVVSSIAGMLHNAARFLIAWQMCMVYFWAGFWKIAGSEWRDGTAMYYVLHLDRFQPFPLLSDALASHHVLVAAMTYGTIGFQMAFPFLMWNQRVKPYMVSIGVMLHIGIAVLLGLVSFSIIMMLADLSLLSDEQFASIGRFAAALVRGLGKRETENTVETSVAS